jgi:hypothetical protein
MGYSRPHPFHLNGIQVGTLSVPWTLKKNSIPSSTCAHGPSYRSNLNGAGCYKRTWPCRTGHNKPRIGKWPGRFPSWHMFVSSPGSYAILWLRRAYTHHAPYVRATLPPRTQVCGCWLWYHFVTFMYPLIYCVDFTRLGLYVCLPPTIDSQGGTKFPPLHVSSHRPLCV